MTSTHNVPLFDKQVRSAIYSWFIKSGHAPTMVAIAELLSCPLADVRAAYQRLAAGRALVLQPDGEVLMANPFSAVPTAFSVVVGGKSWWGNCIWDAMGIPAMLKADARILTSCGCCGQAMTVEIKGGALHDPSGIVHYAIPPREWWNDLVFA